MSLRLNHNQKTYKQNHDRGRLRKNHKYLPGDSVMLQKDNTRIWSPAKIVAPTNYPRSYLIKTENGNILRRNTYHLRRSLNEHSGITIPHTTSPSVNDQQKTSCDYAKPLINDQLKMSLDSNTPLTNETNTNDSGASNDSAYVTRSGRTVKAPERYVSALM